MRCKHQNKVRGKKGRRKGGRTGYREATDGKRREGGAGGREVGREGNMLPF